MGDEIELIKELWRAFLNDAPAGVAIFDRDMRYLEASERWKRDYGLVGRDIMGRSHYEILPEIPERWKEIHRACLAGACDGRDADPFNRSDGRVDWVRWEIRPWRQDDGAIGGIVIFSEIVTDRIEAQEALKASEARYRALIEQAPEAIVIYDRQTGHIVDANRNAERLFGCDRAELLHTSPERFYAADQPDGAPVSSSMREHDRIVAAGGSPSFERHIRNAQGEDFFVEIRLSPLPSETGTLMRASIVDITRRKQAEDALRDQEAKYRGLVEQEIAGIVIVGADGTLVYANQQFAKMVGCAPGDLIGRPILEIVPDDERAVVAQNMERQLGGQSPFIQHASKIVTRGGEVRDILINATRSTHEGRPSSTAVVLDITERRRAEEALRQSEQRYRTTVQIAPVGIVHVGPDGRFLAVNEFFCDLLGYSRERLLAKTVLDITDPEDLASLARQLTKVAEDRVSRGQIVRRFRHRDGRTLWCEITYSVERDALDRVDHVLAIVNDITERRQAEEERFRFASQLQQAQKMEAIGQLTGGMAHDFNNLLGVIIGNLDLLREHFALESDDRELVEAAIAAATRGADLTRHMLAFARRQPLAPTLTDVADVLNGEAKLFRRTLGQNIVLNIALHDRLWPVMVDVAQLETAILNLAVNSRDAMPSGGTLTIAARNATLDATETARNPEAAPGEYVVISVSDSGIGMTPDVAAKAFEPFFTTKGARGSGLGLSSVHGFVKQSGGHTHIASEPGKGTTIAIYLPRATAGAAPSVHAGHDRTAPRGSESILVTEDNEALRKIAVRHLNDLGYHTIAAKDAAEALQVLAGDAAVDLLFTDVVMPGGMDGRALAEAASRLRPGIRVLFTSGFTGAAGMATGVEALAGQLLTKPYRKDELAHAIRTALDTPG